MLNRALATFLPRGTNGRASRVRVERYIKSTYSQGELTEQPPEILSIEAVLAPVNGDDLQTLPEGLDLSNTRRLFCDRELFTSHNREPDTVILDGERYTVIAVTRWPGIPPEPAFFDCFASRNVKQGGE